MIKKNILLIISYFISCNFIYSQQDCDCNNIDFKITIQLLNENDSIQLFNYTKKIKALQNSNCIFDALTIEFQYLRANNKIENLESLLFKQDNLIKDIDCKHEYTYKLNRNKTLYYHSIDDYENMSEYAFKCLEEAELLKSKQKELETLIEIVHLFTRLNEDYKNWEYIKRAESLILSTDSKSNISNLRWLAYQYETQYTLTNRITLIDSVVLFSKRSLDGALKLGINDEIAKNYRALEAASYHQGNLLQGIIYIDSAIFYAKKTKGYYNIGPLYLSKAWDHLDLGQKNEAIIWADSALHFDKKNNAGTAGYMMTNFDLSGLYEEAGDINKSYNCYKEYSTLKDSLFNVDRTKVINELEQKYLKVENEKKIFELEKTKQYYLIIILGSFFILLILILLFRQYSLKSKQKAILAEQRLNRARMDPHFFFNALTSIQSLALKEQSSQTVLLLSKFSKIMRQSLESSYEELVTIEEDCDFLEQYIKLQQLRHPNLFEYNLQIDANIEINEILVPSMILQPFIENSIEHGFKNIDYKGVIEIDFRLNANHLEIIINDNGQVSKKSVKSHISRATQIIKDRLYLLKKQTKKQANFEVIPTTDQTGYKIKLTLPLIYKD